jgi:Swiss Army Knife protein, DSP-PTPase phosphatase domain
MSTIEIPQGANGVLKLRLSPWGLWRQVEVVGGPYRNRSRDHYGVCLLEREPDSCHVWLPIRDFSVPESTTDVEWALTETLHQLLSGRRVWVGCAGGLGRTGLFLALLAKVAGCPDPVAYVRQHYSPHAVETAAQERYVADFPVRRMRWWLLRKSLEYCRSWLSWKLSRVIP